MSPPSTEATGRISALSQCHGAFIVLKENAVQSGIPDLAKKKKLYLKMETQQRCSEIH